MSSNAEKLLGAWRLARWTIAYSDGRAPTMPFGESVTGDTASNNQNIQRAVRLRHGCSFNPGSDGVYQDGPSAPKRDRVRHLGSLEACRRVDKHG